ncbi:unnamed protein product [Caenorhabditis bovis]|uniref:Uncharacterized protein n=1 Tax=Caenorhabditis bovis TaxID=2654633 RepID=A0A8S1FFH7_9PELO|nr:unnamed protein product [Caenorhabditis bovis]
MKDALSAMASDILLRLVQFLRALRAKMNIAHENDMVDNDKIGVYPKIHKMPSPLCCFRIMHIRTGTLWIAYLELMWIVSQFSFWTAESVVKESFHPIVIITGIAFTMLQLVIVIFLMQGVKKFRLAYIEIYLVGISCRILLFLGFFAAFFYYLLFEVTDGVENNNNFFRRFLMIKLIVTAIYIILKLYAFNIAFRCYSYIAKTRRVVLNFDNTMENEL